MDRERGFSGALRGGLEGRGLPMAVAVAWGLTVLLWLLDAVAAPDGSGAPAALDRAVVLATLAATAALVLRQAGRLWRRGTDGRLLLGLVALSGLMYFAGLDHELTTGYFRDEGIYRATADRINHRGIVLWTWFVYPHLLFYLDALALWLADLLQSATTLLAHLLYGVDALEPARLLVLRSVTAAMGALTVVPVFGAARRLGGQAAGLLAGALTAFSPVYLDVAHLTIVDVAAGFFAALAFHACVVLLDGESPRGYLLAGLWAGLAAGSKYPAGLVAVAIAAVWLRWRIAERRWSWGLALAALVSLAAFLLATPSLLAFPETVFLGDNSTDILNGIRQYAQGGWTGVVRDSNLRYYWGLVRLDLGLPAILLGLLGLAGLDRRDRTRMLWVLPFPALYLFLLLGMRIAVVRTMMPVLPALDVLVGVAAAGCLRWLPEGKPRARLAGAALLATAVLVGPAYRAVVRDLRFVRPTTRELAEAWIVENVPPGSFLVHEIYTPKVRPRHLYPARYLRYVVRLPPEVLRHPYHDYVMVASAAYGRFMDHEDDPRARRYREIFDSFPRVREFEPDRFRDGPAIGLYEVDPADPPYAPRLEQAAATAPVSDPVVRPEGGDVARFTTDDQWAMFKGYLLPGSYRLEARGEVAADGGSIRVVTRRGREIATVPVSSEGTAEVRLPAREKYFFYVSLPWGSTLRGFTAERGAASTHEGPAARRPPAPR